MTNTVPAVASPPLPFILRTLCSVWSPHTESSTILEVVSQSVTLTCNVCFSHRVAGRTGMGAGLPATLLNPVYPSTTGVNLTP